MYIVIVIPRETLNIKILNNLDLIRISSWGFS